MRQRLLALLVVALVAALVAGMAANARGGRLRAAHIPALPALAEHGTACPIPVSFRPAFEHASSDAELPLALLVAVAQVESQFQQAARSSAGAQGLLQVMPTTAASLKLDPGRPETNVLAGARYLRGLFDRFHSSDLALAAYNAGPSAVERAGGAPSGVTLAYVVNVTRLWRTLNGCR